MNRIVWLALGLSLVFLVPACSDDQAVEDAAGPEISAPAVSNATALVAEEILLPEGNGTRSGERQTEAVLMDEAASNDLAAPRVGGVSLEPQDMNQAMNMDGDMHAGMSGAPADYSDRIFLSMMIPHHEAAIAMSEDILKTTQDPMILEFAQKVAKDQNGEVIIMEKWLEDMGGKVESAWKEMRAEMEAMNGQTMSDNPDKNYILMMIPHHAMALEMAYPALLQSDDPKVVDLARDIIMQQAEEIRAMRNWLDEHH